MTAAMELFVEYFSSPRVFPNRRINRQRAESGEPGWAQTPPRRGPRAGRPGVGSGHLADPPPVIFWHSLPLIIIRCWQFVPFNSENIFYTTFLKHKNSRKQELALWHLVNRLVPENAKYCIKRHIKHMES